jgi:ribosomal subunit interface protein
MRIQVQGKQIDVGNALTEHVTRQLSAAVEKYFDRPIEAIVTFSRDARAYRCDAHVHLPTGLTAASSATASDVYAAFEQGAERIEKQIRRYKRRLRDHHQNRRKPIEAVEAAAYVLEAGNGRDESDEPESLQPVIVAEMKQSIQSLSVGEAVMQLELANKAFLMFRNDGNGRFNVVYRREDGNIGWVDPANLSANLSAS